MIGPDEGGDLLAQQILRDAHRLVRALVGAPDERLPLLDPAIGGAVEQDVVVGGIGHAAGSVGDTRPRNWCWISSVAG